jgi:hypothetical protein
MGQRFGWREVQDGPGEPPRWTLAGPSDTPGGREDALPASIQFATDTLNELSVKFAIERLLPRETAGAMGAMAGHGVGGVLAVAIGDTRTDGWAQATTIISVSLMSPLRVYGHPRDAISVWKHQSQLAAPSQDPRSGGSLTYYFFWGTWVDASR